MRSHGLVSDVPGPGDVDHVCWVYDGDDDDLDRAVGRFLAGGLDRGERLLCVGDRVVASLRSPAAAVGDVNTLLAEGTLQTRSIGDAYDATSGFSPEEQFTYYDTETRRALEEGYQGLRVVADVSALADDPAHRAALVRWEHLADQYVASGSGFTAMCAYSGELTGDAVDDLTSVHPLVHAPGRTPAFQLFFDDDNRLTLTGSVDTFSAGRLGRVLAVSPVRPPGVALDLSELEFIDVAACRVLARWAAGLSARSVAVELVGASALLQRMWRLLSLDAVAPVAFTRSGS